MKIIEHDKNYEFAFVEDLNHIVPHPVANYYLKINDLSVNLLINLKWIKWGFFFLNELSKALNNEDMKDIKLNDLIDESIQKIKNIEDKNHILLLDDYIINSEKELFLQLTTIYSYPIFTENTLIHFKLKINLADFLIISHLYYPTLMKTYKRHPD